MLCFIYNNVSFRLSVHWLETDRQQRAPLHDFQSHSVRVTDFCVFGMKRILTNFETGLWRIIERTLSSATLSVFE
jgi:hypothetical protein